MTTFRDNSARQRYELETSDGTTIAEYRDVAHARVLTHFESPEAARGKGYAAQLMAEIVTEARAAGRKLRAACPYAVAYFARHPKDVADVSAD